MWQKDVKDLDFYMSTFWYSTKGAKEHISLLSGWIIYQKKKGGRKKTQKKKAREYWWALWGAIPSLISKADQDFVSALCQCEGGNLSLFISGYSSVLKRDLLSRAFSQHGFSFLLCMCEWNQPFNKVTESVLSALGQHWICRHNANLLPFLFGRFCLFCGWENWLEPGAVSNLMLC